MADGALSPTPPLPVRATETPKTSTDEDMASSSSASASQLSGAIPAESRTSSTKPRVDSRRISRNSLTPRPISAVVSDAFHDAPATNQIDPDIIKMISAQVTEQVMKTLKEQQQAATPAPSEPPTPQFPRSPTQTSVDSFPERYTPPSPHRPYQARVDSPSSELEHTLFSSSKQFDQNPEDETNYTDSSKPEEEPKPATQKSVSNTATKQQSSVSSSGTAKERDNHNDRDTASKRASRTDSKISEEDYDGAASRNRTVADAQSTDTGETALERAWQPLFIDGVPTPRLGSFLKGVAIYLIDDHEPKRSLVVTPQKMLKYFDHTTLEEEHYPWNIIFGKLNEMSLSNVYRKLGCEFHLVQKTNQDHPTVPALTPWGFEWFMTCLIQAHPDKEYERLKKIVMNMPISSADDRTYRFPKEISRRLLPNEPNTQAQQRLVSSMNHDSNVMGGLRGNITMPPPPPPPPASAPPPQVPSTSSFVERPRQPYTHYNNFIDDDDLGSPAPPIERERQPYSGREGKGKVYGSEDARSQHSQHRPDTNARAPRTNSGLPPQAMHSTSSGLSDPMAIPQRNTHRQSVGQGGPPVPPQGMNGGAYYPRPTRGRSSPPPQNLNNRSDPYVGSLPPQHHSSNLHPSVSSPVPGNLDEEAYSRSMQNRYRSERGPGSSIGGSEEAGNTRGFPIPARNTPAPQPFDYPAGSMGGPVGDLPPPAGNYPIRRSMAHAPPAPVPTSERDRRRSVYAPKANSDGGTDSYGSFAEGVNGQYPPQMPPPGTSAQY